MKRNDWILISIVLILSSAGLLFHYFKNDSIDGRVIITVDKKEFGTYFLNEDQEIDINGTNTLVIQGGKADMVQADCPDGICVNQKAISKNGESIICLPNKITVTVKSQSKNDVDGVAF